MRIVCRRDLTPLLHRLVEPTGENGHRAQGSPITDSLRKALSSARHFADANDAQVATQPRHGSAPAKRTRPSNASSIRSASFHFAMRSERENEPTLS
jgi:hypothetical protein